MDLADVFAVEGALRSRASITTATATTSSYTIPILTSEYEQLESHMSCNPLHHMSIKYQTHRKKPTDRPKKPSERPSQPSQSICPDNYPDPKKTVGRTTSNPIRNWKGDRPGRWQSLAGVCLPRPPRLPRNGNRWGTETGPGPVDPVAAPAGKRTDGVACLPYLTGCLGAASSQFSPPQR